MKFQLLVTYFSQNHCCLQRILCKKDLHGEQGPDIDVFEYHAECPKVTSAKWILHLRLWWKSICIEQTDEHVLVVLEVVDGSSSTPLYLFV